MSAFQSLAQLRDLPRLHDLIQQTAPTCETLSHYACAWEQERVANFETLARRLNSSKQQLLKHLLNTHAPLTVKHDCPTTQPRPLLYLRQNHPGSQPLRRMPRLRLAPGRQLTA